jgi:uncharacterized membrane protein YhaH (DUF805 family)
MNNPYASPHANVTDFDDNETYQPRIFSAQGRIGRLRYMAYSCIVQFVLLFFVGIAAAALMPALNGGNEAAGSGFIMIAMLIYIPIIAAAFIMAKRRLNDLDRSGWLAILLLVPLVNLFLAIYMLFWPGSTGSNSYGPKPEANSSWLYVFIIVPILLGILAAIALPAYQDYVKRSQSIQTPQVLPQANSQ